MEKKFNFICQNKDNVLIAVKLVPNSSFNKFVDYTDDYVRIKISSPPVENRANIELINFLSKFFDVNKSKIKIVSGEKSKLKKVQINDKNLDYFSQKLLFVLDSVQQDN